MLSTQGKIDYDKKYDVLYCTIGDTSNSYGDELDRNIILLKDLQTDAVTGITVLGYREYCEDNSEINAVLKKYFDMKDIHDAINSGSP